MSARAGRSTNQAAKAAVVPARERLLQAAARLFYRDGIVATGIDSLVEQAGVAKKSLYNNFASKEALVVDYLEARHAEWLALHERRLAAAETPEAAVMAVFLAYEDHANQAYERGFRGCGLLNAAAELPAGSPGRERVREHKEAVEALLAEAVARQPGRSPESAERLAAHLAFLLEGAMARAGLEGSSARVAEARALAGKLLEKDA
ncbi:TetR/AcrR family transcriptional regulator [Salinicola avicenniae]|uniref:TetR/AcrR family transcriptional regulator n=1 Tax=Salinicola avicenniae TaxID=2916836 RepID=UPI002073BEE7|nr:MULTISPECIES: TetR/AcrR family transcriptional regulator [unclassified Salinicola]